MYKILLFVHFMTNTGMYDPLFVAKRPRNAKQIIEISLRRFSYKYDSAKSIENELVEIERPNLNDLFLPVFFSISLYAMLKEHELVEFVLDHK